MGKRTAYLLCMIAMAVLCLAAAPCAFAGELTVTASAPANGDAAAPVSGKFWVQFSNNVAAVEDNAEYVTLETIAGEKVAASKCKVTLPDVQLEFQYRQYVFLEVKGLKPGARYRIHISKKLTAKNGYRPSQDLDIFFNTAKKGEATTELAEPTAVEAGSGSGNGTGTSGIANAADNTQQGENVVVDLTGDSKSVSGGEELPLQVVVVLVIVALVLVVSWVLLIRKKRKRP